MLATWRGGSNPSDFTCLQIYPSEDCAVVDDVPHVIAEPHIARSKGGVFSHQCHSIHGSRIGAFIERMKGAWRRSTESAFALGQILLEAEWDLPREGPV